jgi:hypothetical protein
MARVDQMDLGVRQVALEGTGAVRAEDLIPGAPDREQRNLAGAEVLLDGRVQVDVRRVLAEKLELDGVVARAVQQQLVQCPRVRAHQPRVWHSVEVLPAGAVQGEGGAHGGFGVRAGRGRVREKPVPERLHEAFGVRVSVLRDDRGDPIGVAQRQSPTDRCAVVLHVHGVPLDAELGEQAGSDAGQGVEGVVELVHRRHGAVAEADVVGGDDPVPVGQRRDEVPEHVRAGGVAVQ